MALTLLQYAAQYFPNDGTAYGVAVQLNQSSQLMPLMRMQQSGLVHKFGREESGGEIARRSVNNPFPDTKPGIVVPSEERIEIAGAKVATDHRLVESTQGKAQAAEIARRTRVLGRYIDKQILCGDGINDPTQIMGLRDRIDVAPQLVTAGANGAALTLAMLEDLIDSVWDQGAGRIVLANKKICRQIKRLIVASAGGASVADATSAVMSYEGVKIVPTDKDEAGADLLPFTETQGSSNATSSLYCIAPGPEDNTGTNMLIASNGIEVLNEGLRDSMQNDVVEVAFGLSIFVKRSASRLKGVKAA